MGIRFNLPRNVNVMKELKWLKEEHANEAFELARLAHGDEGTDSEFTARPAGGS